MIIEGMVKQATVRSYFETLKL